MNYTPKPLFIERMRNLLENEDDLQKYLESLKTTPRKSIRVNTLKISPDELLKRLKEKNWGIKQPFKEYPEIIIIESELEPGKLGKAKEHLLGYYYIQELTSMMPILALNPKPDELMLDLCASPGSKTTQSAARMENKGMLIANDVSMGRVSILCANLEKTGVTNAIVTRHDGLELCNRLKKLGMKFDKILVDAPCSGEGNIRLSPRTLLEWSEGLLERLGKKNKKLAQSAFELLKPNGEMIYSTCTHSPEENEEVVQHLLDNYKDSIKIEKISLPLKTRPGITKWKNKIFSDELKKCIRIYPHDNNMEGFFVCKIRKL